MAKVQMYVRRGIIVGKVLLFLIHARQAHLVIHQVNQKGIGRLIIEK